jgi:CheY-like chemotaxis protein
MYKIAVVDDDKTWCFAIERFLRSDFEVFTFTKISNFLDRLPACDLVIVDYSIAYNPYEERSEGCKLIRYLKKTLPNPPLLVLASAVISKNDLECGKEICPEADAFLAKDAGLERLMQQIKQLLSFHEKGSI